MNSFLKRILRAGSAPTARKRASGGDVVKHTLRAAGTAHMLETYEVGAHTDRQIAIVPPPSAFRGA